tara:strand:+ start:12527 stop:13405 length:879 start_codon:yes stop_codon:yes gene_type:complete
MKKTCLISFSGGETSAYMAKWLLENKSNEYDFVSVFANTGQENEETLKFVDQCDKAFNMNLVWIEAKINQELGKGTRWNIVNYETASRNGEVFEDAIKKYGIPNLNNNWCTRDLKIYPIHNFMKLGLKLTNYDTAIGIRVDEIDRVSKNRVKDQFIYPLVSMKPMTKPQINKFWSNQSFRLNLKGYEGNCKACWKKSFNKLMTIAVEKPEYFDFVIDMESKYADYIPPQKAASLESPNNFFRQNKSVIDIFKESRKPFKKSKNDADIYEYQTSMFGYDLDSSNGCDESCEIH